MGVFWVIADLGSAIDSFPVYCRRPASADFLPNPKTSVNDKQIGAVRFKSNAPDTPPASEY
jgi:hypothetical protein